MSDKPDKPPYRLLLDGKEVAPVNSLDLGHSFKFDVADADQYEADWFKSIITEERAKPRDPNAAGMTIDFTGRVPVGVATMLCPKCDAEVRETIVLAEGVASIEKHTWTCAECGMRFHLVGVYTAGFRSLPGEVTDCTEDVPLEVEYAGENDVDG